MIRSRLLRAALRYARRGWSVFPLNGKVPYPGSHGHKDATTDRKQIKRWWRRWPNANIGIRCDSETGPVVIDVDGRSGFEYIEKLGLPFTRMATSQGNEYKQHLYFMPHPSQSIPRLIKPFGEHGPTFDILGDGGYVVAPPSVHPRTRKTYKWLNKLPLEPVPDAIARIVQKKIKHKKRSAAPPLPDILSEGERDSLLTSLAGTMRRRGAGESAILAALREENETRVLPPLPDKQLRKIAASIVKKEPAVKLPNFTDLGNARRFIQRYGLNVKGVRTLRKPWLIWEGTRWTGDNSGEVERMAKETVRALWQEAEQVEDEELQGKILKHALVSEGAARIKALLELAGTEPEIMLSQDQLDANSRLFNVENGTINLKTGVLQPHRRDDHLTKITSVHFDPKATAPRWMTFLHEVMNGDPELVEFLQRAVGYSLTGDTREQCLFFCYGQGANGKSTFLEILRELFGDYSQQADFTTFLARKGDGPRNDLARMRGARLITAVEAPGDRGFDEMVLKQLTGGDTVVARRLYEEFFEFKPQHKLWLAANHKPMVKEQTEAFWRRIRLIPFMVTFKKDARDQALQGKLRKELPGILNWALEGTQKWYAEGLTEPKAVRLATKSYREENDLLGEFLVMNAIVDEQAWTPTTELYRRFVEWWTETRGSRNAPTMMWFGRLLSERPDLKAAKKRMVRGWSGIALKKEF